MEYKISDRIICSKNKCHFVKNILSVIYVCGNVWACMCIENHDVKTFL